MKARERQSGQLGSMEDVMWSRVLNSEFRPGLIINTMRGLWSLEVATQSYFYCISCGRIRWPIFTRQAHTNLARKLYKLLLHDITIHFSGLQNSRGIVFELCIRALSTLRISFNISRMGEPHISRDSMQNRVILANRIEYQGREEVRV